MEPLPEPISIFIGDGRSIQATHKGIIELKVDKSGSQPLSLTFDNVLYVPQASVNLLSIGQASKAGLNFLIADGRMDFVDKESNQTIHSIYPSEHNMYRLHIRPRLEAHLSESGPQSWNRMHRVSVI